MPNEVARSTTRQAIDCGPIVKLRRAATVIAVNVVVFLALAEIVSLCAYAWETGALYYVHQPDRPTPRSTESLDKHRIHPYFGYVWRPFLSVKPRRNNHGFVSAVDYPHATEREVIGIFGGSLAANLATYEAAEGVLKTGLADRLGKSPEDFEVLNFAQAGYKQPQQLLVATYFRALGQPLDLAINLDGFNELTLGTINALSDWQIAMPSRSHFGPLRDVVSFRESSSQGLQRMVTIRRHWNQFTYHHNRAWSRAGWETSAASGFLYNWLLCKFHLTRYQRTFQQHRMASAAGGDSASWLYVERGRAVTKEDDEEYRDEVATHAVALWARAARDFHRLQTAAGDGFLQVLQPNQYHATDRVFPPEEQAIAFSEHSPFAPFVPQGYPRLEASLDELRADGVRAWSATRLFDDVTEPVYRDDCCHLNDLGHRILAEKLAELAAAELAGAGDSAPESSE